MYWYQLTSLLGRSNVANGTQEELSTTVVKLLNHRLWPCRIVT